MRAGPAARRADGPFLLPARWLVLGAGLLAVALGIFNLFHELHSKLVDGVYTIVALAVAAAWLACLVLAFRGFRLGVFGAGAIAFVEFCVIIANHFVTGPGELFTFAKQEGLAMATADMALVLACTVVVMAAAVSWTNPRRRSRRFETLPLLLVALVGGLLVILTATDGVHRDKFGAMNPEDGSFIATAAASIWLAGGLWIARVRRTGAFLIALAAVVVCYTFVMVHYAKGGTPLSVVAAESGVVWAVIAAAAVILAAASFLVVLGLLALPIIRRKPTVVSAGTQPARRGA